MLRATLAVGVVAALATASPAVAAKTPIPGIRTPSGNIACLFVPGAPAGLHCAIEAASYSTALQGRCMKNAGLDWHGFELTPTTRGAVTCTGGILYSPGTQRPVYRTLAYGKTWRHGGFTCASATNGLTCRNRKGHGLFIARESWRAW